MFRTTYEKNNDNNAVIWHTNDLGKWWCCCRNPSYNVVTVIKRWWNSTATYKNGGGKW